MYAQRICGVVAISTQGALSGGKHKTSYLKSPGLSISCTRTGPISVGPRRACRVIGRDALDSHPLLLDQSVNSLARLFHVLKLLDAEAVALQTLHPVRKQDFVDQADMKQFRFMPQADLPHAHYPASVL